MINYLKNREIKLSEFIDSTKTFLYDKFNIKRETFSYANPVGQIILVVKNITRVVFFYIKDASNQTNFKTANRTHTVHGLAQLQGHNAFRGRAAQMIIKLVLKPEADIGNIYGGKIYIPDHLKLNCINNGLIYSLVLSKEFEVINVENYSSVKFGVVQGQFREKSYTGNGESVQTISVVIPPNDKVDHDLVFVNVNGKKYNKYDSYHNSLFMDRLFMVKTGLTSGFDLVFGKKNSHEIPKEGENIEVKYLTHSGVLGNVENPMLEFNDSGYDERGENINLSDYFTIGYELNGAYLGSNPEDFELTKVIAPNIIPNSIIHDKKSLSYNIMMLNLFANHKITRTESTYKVILYPRISEKLLASEDYFSFDYNLLLLSTTEKIRILEKFNEIQSNNIEVVIENPKLVKFGINIVIESFETNNNNETKKLKEVRETLSNYMISLKRLNKVPKSDILKILDSLNFVDSVNAEFIVQKESMIDSLESLSLNETDIAVLRGEFTDYEGNVVSDDFNYMDNLSVVNIEIRYS